MQTKVNKRKVVEIVEIHSASELVRRQKLGSWSKAKHGPGDLRSVYWNAEISVLEKLNHGPGELPLWTRRTAIMENHDHGPKLVRHEKIAKPKIRNQECL